LENIDFELAIMQLETNEPKIMERMRKGVFTNKESGFLICGICNVLEDKETDPVGFKKRMERVQILIDDVIRNAENN